MIVPDRCILGFHVTSEKKINFLSLYLYQVKVISNIYLFACLTAVISHTRPPTIFFHFENYVLVDVNQMYP